MVNLRTSTCTIDRSPFKFDARRWLHGYIILDQTSLTAPVPSLSHWFGVRRLILGSGKRLLSCHWHAASGSRIRLVSQGCFVGDDDRMKHVS